jgi:hypothetical protein
MAGDLGYHPTLSEISIRNTNQDATGAGPRGSKGNTRAKATSRWAASPARAIRAAQAASTRAPRHSVRVLDRGVATQVAIQVD